MKIHSKNWMFIGTFILFFFTSYISFSQSEQGFGHFYHGFEIGINWNNAEFAINDSSDPSSAFGFFVGYMAERDLSDRLYVRFGLNYNKREINAVSKRGINTTEEKWGIDVLEIPINMGYYVNWNNKNLQFFVDGGINLGFNARATVKNDVETIRLDIGSDADINRFTIGANAGVGLLLKRRTKIRLNYYNSLSNIVNIEDDIWKNKTVSISLSYFLKEKQVY